MTDPLDRDPRRFFSRTDVNRAWQRQGQRCALCGRELPVDLMHGDHVLPHSRGGPTTIDNLQALCGSCNLRKGSRPQEVVRQAFGVERIGAGVGGLRRWQSEALDPVTRVLGDEPALVEACPGAGKTRFALEVTYQLVKEGRVSRVIVVAPTLGIVDGWCKAASARDPGSPVLPLLSSRDWRPVNPIGESQLGVVITYQSLFALTDMFLAHATDPGHRTLVIFDEVHHAGVDSGWGEAAQVAFADAAEAILSLSGTLFRTGKDPIVFVPSENGAARPHFRYSYDDAIRDGACRPVQFVEARGHTTFRTEDGATHTVSFDDIDLTDVGERRRLRAALEAVDQGTVAEKMLADANRYILELRRRGDSDAAGLVVCVDCDHASTVASFMADHILGKRPVVACSRTHDDNDPDPANAIEKFRDAHDPWIVAVNMISEGIDITRLRVVVYLTNRLTLLSFRQIVGRVVRTDRDNVDDHGRVYIPADHRLIDMAHHITDQVDLLPPPLTIVTDSTNRPVPIRGDSNDGSAFETLATVGEQGAAFDTAGRYANQDLVSAASRFIDQHNLTGTDPESLALAASENPALQAELLRGDE